MSESIVKRGSLAGFNDVFTKIFSEDFDHPLKAKSITFVVTQDCTLRCSYCYETHKNKDHDMTFETGKKLVDMMFKEDANNSPLINSVDAAAVILDFIGGEPLLKINLIDQIMEYFLKKAIKLNHRWQTNYMISMTSNGTEYFTPEVQSFLKKYNGRVSLGITVDGNKELHDKCRRFVDGRPSYDISSKALLDAMSKGYTADTKMTISRENLPYLYDALLNIFNYPNISFIPANPTFEAKWTLDDAKLYYNQLKKIGDYMIDNKLYTKLYTTLFDESIGKTNDDDKNWCGGGSGVMLAFDSNGDIYPCLRFLPFALRYRSAEQLKLGNVDSGMLVSEESKKAKIEMDSLTRTSQSTKKCNECKIRTGCAWCSAWNYDLYGTINKRCTNICPMHQARVMANAYYWNKLYRLLDMEDRFDLNIPEDWALEIISKNEFEMLTELAKKGN